MVSFEKNIIQGCRSTKHKVKLYEFCSELLVHLIFCPTKIVIRLVACFIVLSRRIKNMTFGTVAP